MVRAEQRKSAKSHGNQIPLIFVFGVFLSFSVLCFCLFGFWFILLFCFVLQIPLFLSTTSKFFCLVGVRIHLPMNPPSSGFPVHPDQCLEAPASLSRQEQGLHMCLCMCLRSCARSVHVTTSREETVFFSFPPSLYLCGADIQMS